MIDAAAFTVPVRGDIVGVMEREWDRLSRPGTTLTAYERTALAAAARTPVQTAGGEPKLEAATRIAHDAHSIDRAFVDGLCDRGVTAAEYVEIIGLVSRLAAIDTFHRLLGAPPPPLPLPTPGDPSNDLNPMAQPGRAFVPMVRGASIIYALTLIPDEHEAMMDDVHDTFYLSTTQMQQPTSPRAITRPQIELLGTLTSVENECFY